MYLCNSQQTCSYSNLVQNCAGEKVRLFKTFHTLRTGLLTFAHRDNQGLVRKILSCSLTSKLLTLTTNCDAVKTGLKLGAHMLNVRYGE